MPKEPPPIPSVLVFLVCDQVIQEAGTNKKSLIGMFDRIYAKQVPAAGGPFWLFAKIVDAEGNYSFRIEVVKLETDKQIGRMDMPPMPVPDRLAGAELVLRIPMLPFEEYGTYEFNL